MPIEMGMWRIDDGAPRRLSRAALPSEATLEDFLARDPSLLGEPLLVIGRQVRTPYGKYIDLLAMDRDGNLRVLELKRDRTPREVVAQVLDYGSWISTLERQRIVEIANQYLSAPFEEAFSEVFDAPPPDELNTELQLTVVAGTLDDSSERIVAYLRSFGVPVNAVFFAYLEDEGRRYLTRSWLASGETGATPAPQRTSSKRAEWNGHDWYVSFGDDSTSRNWDDARRYGFVSAGGGEWYSRTLRNLPEGARIFVHIPKLGFVGVGETLGTAQPFASAQVWDGDAWIPLAAQELVGTYRNNGSVAGDEDGIEYVVPVRWIAAVPRDDAYWIKGLFANQNSATKLRQEFTLQKLTDRFDLDTEEN